MCDQYVTVCLRYVAFSQFFPSYWVCHMVTLLKMTIQATKMKTNSKSKDLLKEEAAHHIYLLKTQENSTERWNLLVKNALYILYYKPHVTYKDLIIPNTALGSSIIPLAVLAFHPGVFWVTDAVRDMRWRPDTFKATLEPILNQKHCPKPGCRSSSIMVSEH